MSQKNWAIKSQQVNDLTLQLQANSFFLIYEYAGLTAKEISLLRRDLRKDETRMLIRKNNILNRALIKSGIVLDADFTGPNALLLAQNDFQSFKKITLLAKKKNFIKLKAAYLDGAYLGKDKITKLETLPTKPNLYVMICNCLQSPLIKLLFAIKEIAAQKEQI